jgi:hypothetical protein
MILAHLMTIYFIIKVDIIFITKSTFHFNHFFIFLYYGPSVPLGMSTRRNISWLINGVIKKNLKIVNENSNFEKFCLFDRGAKFGARAFYCPRRRQGAEQGSLSKFAPRYELFYSNRNYYSRATQF